MSRLLLIFPEVRSSLMTQTPRIESLCISVLTSYSNIPRILLSLSGHLLSSASIQKLFCGSCSTCRGSFDVFVGEKVVSPSYSSTILGRAPKALLRGKLITIHSYLKNKEKSQINKLKLYVKQLEKEKNKT